MSNLDLSRSAKALLNAAKSDGPSTAARAKIWGGVASGASAVGAGVVGAGAIAAGSASAAPPALTSATSASLAGGGIHAATALAGGGKLLAMGALFGSALTVGIAATLLGIGRTPSLLPDPQYAESAPMVQPAYTNGGGVHPSGAAVNARVNTSSGDVIGNRTEDETANGALANSGNALNALGAPGTTSTPGPNADSLGTNGALAANGLSNSAGANGDKSDKSDKSDKTGLAGNGSGNAANGAASGASGSASPSTANAPGVHHDSAVRAVREDTLMRESALVSEARGALMRGDSKTALAALKTTKTLKHRELEPEELSLEAKALRAMGRDGDAASLEIVLKSRYPDHALAR